jgi:hypothetical protein
MTVRSLISGVTLAVACVAMAHASEIRVLDASGSPVPETAVVCLGRESGAANAGPDGVAKIPDECRRVRCQRGDFVSVDVPVQGGKAECRFAAPLLIVVDPLPPDCAEKGCSAHARRLDGNVRDPGMQAGDGWNPASPHFRQRTSLHLTPMLPGHVLFSYALGVMPAGPFWTCETDLGIVPAGRLVVTPVWRRPSTVTVQVLGGDDRPRADVPVRVRVPLHQPGEDPPGTWHCSLEPEPRDGFRSGPDGSLTVEVDPGGHPIVEAGDPQGPEGFVSRVLDVVPDGPLVLRLRRP